MTRRRVTPPVPDSRRARGAHHAAIAAGLAVLLSMLLGLLPGRSTAQEFEFHPPASAHDDRATAVMRDLAARILPVYQEVHPERYLGNLSALQGVAGDYAAADATRQTLRERNRSASAAPAPGTAVLYDIYTRARVVESEKRLSFEQAFTQTYREIVSQLGDRAAYEVTGLAPVALASLEDALQQGFDRRRASGNISLADAVSLVWAYFAFDANRSFGGWLGALGAEDDDRRYIIDDTLVIVSADGARIPAALVRPRAAVKPLPALLEFTIHVDPHNFARECAAHGYAGVIAYTRGRGNQPAAIVPFEHDGADAQAVIDWIARQPWSDGRVAMYGDGYSAYAGWAAAMRAPPALKALATSDAMAPGIDFPMQGNIFQNPAYRWVTEVMTTTTASNTATNTAQQSLQSGAQFGAAAADARWQALYRTWYRDGAACGDLDQLYGRPSWIFHRWLNHPSYDQFWQALIPDSRQFGRITLPVLSISGYYAAAESGSLYLFQHHQRQHPRADQTLLIGPYDDGAARRPAAAVLRSYQVDPVAAVDLRELRYQWFDFILRGAARPALLKDRVNYQVMGANAWRHAPSLQAMGDGSIRFYLDPSATGDAHRLVRQKGPDGAFLRQSVDLADRRDAGWTSPAALSGNSIATRDGVVFVSDPLDQAVELGGLFSGRLDLMINMLDLDLTIQIYEQLPGGEYLQLFDPAYEFRASYARDRAHRHLLRSGERQQLDFVSERLTSRMLQARSRLVVVLRVNKRPDQEINYGTGKDVREETIADAVAPLKIRWYGGSYIDLPIRK